MKNKMYSFLMHTCGVYASIEEMICSFGMQHAVPAKYLGKGRVLLDNTEYYIPWLTVINLPEF